MTRGVAFALVASVPLLLGGCALFQPSLKSECGAGRVEACLEWGREGQSRSDVLEAREAYTQACAQESARGCLLLGELEARPPTGTPAWLLAEGAYVKACKAGEALACFRLGELSDAGFNGVRDDTQTHAPYRQACEGGVPEGCRRLKALEAMQAEQAAVKGRSVERKDTPGGYDKEVLAEGIRKGQRSIQVCFEQELVRQPGPNLEGRLMVRFSVEPSGRVTSVAPAEVSLASAPMVACILHVTRTLRFPPGAHEGTTIVNYPWVFKVGR